MLSSSTIVVVETVVEPVLVPNAPNPEVVAVVVDNTLVDEDISAGDAKVDVVAAVVVLLDSTVPVADNTATTGVVDPRSTGAVAVVVDCDWAIAMFVNRRVATMDTLLNINNYSFVCVTSVTPYNCITVLPTK